MPPKVTILIRKTKKIVIMKSVVAILFAVLASTNAIELTADNYDTETAGKTIFVKFFAPWCGHCKSLKPAWDKLMKEFADSETALVGDVDCTGEGGEELCMANDVQGYPTLKYGDPSSLEDYEGGRDFADLKKFAEENLKPMCSPTNIDLCDAEKKAEIEKFQALSDEELDSAIGEKTKLQQEAEEDFENKVMGLQEMYEKMEAEKAMILDEIKQSGLGLMKAIKASRGKKGSDEL